MAIEQRTASLREGRTENATVYKRWAAITPGPTNLAPSLKLLYIGGAGNVTIENSAGDSVVVAAIAGMYIPADIIRVTAATATGLVGFW